jgi:hypothetical protein
MAGPAVGTQVTTNFSDLWWIPAESGWGLNVTQQADVLFATWFVYGPGKEPIWYSATLAKDPVSADGTTSFQGELVQTTGPWFGAGTFNPALVTRQGVGAAHFAPGTVSTATLTYTTGGVTVTKQIERQTLKSNNMAGTYVGGMTATTFNCQSSGDNGQDVGGSDALSVSHVGSSVTISSEEGCVFRAQYRQAGQVGYLDAGTVTCPGVPGTATFAGYEVAVETTGILLRYVMSGPNCSVRGNIAGARLE